MGSSFEVCSLIQWCPSISGPVPVSWPTRLPWERPDSVPGEALTTGYPGGQQLTGRRVTWSLKGVSSSLLSVPLAFRVATTRWEAQPEGRILGNTGCPPRRESRRREKLQLPEGSTNGCAGTTPRGWGRFRN